MTREEWILSHQWRLGRVGGSVICDPAGAMENCTEEDARREAGLYDFYGGFPVLESCPTSVCLHIIRMHNCHAEVVAALSAAVKKMEQDEETMENEWGRNRTIAEIEAAGHLPQEILDARAALAKAEGK